MLGCVVVVTVKDPLGNKVDNPALDIITVTISGQRPERSPGSIRASVAYTS